MSRPAEHPPGYKENEYSVTVKCWNCLKIYIIFIEKGVLVMDAIEGRICNMCGCAETLEHVII